MDVPPGRVIAAGLHVDPQLVRPSDDVLRAETAVLGHAEPIMMACRPLFLVRAEQALAFLALPPLRVPGLLLLGAHGSVACRIRDWGRRTFGRYPRGDLDGPGGRWVGVEQPPLPPPRPAGAADRS